MKQRGKNQEQLLQAQHSKVMKYRVVPMAVLFGSILVFYVVAPLLLLPLRIVKVLYQGSYVFGTLLLLCNIFLLNHNYRVVKEKRHFAEPAGAIWFLCAIAVFGGILGAFLLAKYEGAYGFYSKELFLGMKITRNMSLYGAMLFLPAVAYPFHLMVPLSCLRPQIKRNYDYLIIGCLSIMTFVKFGCHAAGCCAGIQIDPILFGRGLFPVQLMEALCLLAMLIFFMWYQMKCKRRILGASYPLGLLLYCPVRFVWEFFRSQQGFDRMFVFSGLMTFWQFLSVLGFVAGAIWLGLLLWQNKKKA